jgi:hypothetical protein
VNITKKLKEVLSPFHDCGKELILGTYDLEEKGNLKLAPSVP